METGDVLRAAGAVLRKNWLLGLLVLVQTKLNVEIR